MSTETVPVEHLRELMTVASLVTSTLDSKEIRRRSVEAATRLVDAERASLLLVDRKGKDLYFEVALGDDAEHLSRVRIVPGEGVAGTVLDTCEPMIINDVASDPRHLQAVDEAIGFVTRSILGVPVRCKERSLGVLEVLNKRGGGFEDEDIKLISALANQIAVAVENAELYQKVRRAYIETWLYAAISAAVFVAIGVLLLR